MISNYIYLRAEDQPWWFRLLMTPLSYLFLILVRLRKLVYRFKLKQSRVLPPYVISVGNISVGGTGKTPFVIALCKKLRERGNRPAILTRGYKSGLRRGELAIILDGKYVVKPDNEIELAADEAMMQSVKLPQVPVILSASRFDAAKVFLGRSGFKPTHWILDDGFQHWSIHRDLDIVLLNKSNPFASRCLLPRGFLREPLNALRRADIIIWSGVGQPNDEDIETAELYGRLFLTSDIRVCEPKLIRGPAKDIRSNDVRVMAVSAIARPKRFIESLKSLGVNPDYHWALPDHQRFGFDDIVEQSRQFDVVFTTEKDYWRDQSIFDRLTCTVYTLPVEVDIPDEIFEL